MKTVQGASHPRRGLEVHARPLAKTSIAIDAPLVDSPECRVHPRVLSPLGLMGDPGKRDANRSHSVQ